MVVACKKDLSAIESGGGHLPPPSNKNHDLGVSTKPPPGTGVGGIGGGSSSFLLNTSTNSSSTTSSSRSCLVVPNFGRRRKKNYPKTGTSSSSGGGGGGIGGSGRGGGGSGSGSGSGGPTASSSSSTAEQSSTVTDNFFAPQHSSYNDRQSLLDSANRQVKDHGMIDWYAAGGGAGSVGRGGGGGGGGDGETLRLHPNTLPSTTKFSSPQPKRETSFIITPSPPSSTKGSSHGNNTSTSTTESALLTLPTPTDRSHTAKRRQQEQVGKMYAYNGELEPEGVRGQEARIVETVTSSPESAVPIRTFNNDKRKEHASTAAGAAAANRRNTGTSSKSGVGGSSVVSSSNPSVTYGYGGSVLSGLTEESQPDNDDTVGSSGRSQGPANKGRITSTGTSRDANGFIIKKRENHNQPSSSSSRIPSYGTKKTTTTTNYSNGTSTTNSISTSTTRSSKSSTTNSKKKKQIQFLVPKETEPASSRSRTAAATTTTVTPLGASSRRSKVRRGGAGGVLRNPTYSNNHNNNNIGSDSDSSDTTTMREILGNNQDEIAQQQQEQYSSSLLDGNNKNKKQQQSGRLESQRERLQHRQEQEQEQQNDKTRKSNIGNKNVEPKPTRDGNYFNHGNDINNDDDDDDDGFNDYPRQKPVITRRSAPVSVDDTSFQDPAENVQGIHAMAMEHVVNGEYDMALQAFTQVLQVYLDQHGRAHPLTASAYHNLGTVHSKRAGLLLDHTLHQRHCREQALLCFQSAARSARDAPELGPDHPNVAVSLVRIGFLLLQSRQYQNAVITFEEALRIRVQNYGDSHALVANLYNNLGVCHMHLEEFPEGRKYLQQALDIQKRLLAQDELSTTALLELADTLCNIGGLCLEWIRQRGPDGRHAQDAESAFAEALEVRIRVLGETHALTNQVRSLHDMVRSIPLPKVHNPPSSRSTTGGGSIGGGSSIGGGNSPIGGNSHISSLSSSSPVRRQPRNNNGTTTKTTTTTTKLPPPRSPPRRSLLSNYTQKLKNSGNTARSPNRPNNGGSPGRPYATTTTPPSPSDRHPAKGPPLQTQTQRSLSEHTSLITTPDSLHMPTLSETKIIKKKSNDGKKYNEDDEFDDDEFDDDDDDFFLSMIHHDTGRRRKQKMTNHNDDPNIFDDFDANGKSLFLDLSNMKNKHTHNNNNNKDHSMTSATIAVDTSATKNANKEESVMTTFSSSSSSADEDIKMNSFHDATEENCLLLSLQQDDDQQPQHQARKQQRNGTAVGNDGKNNRNQQEEEEAEEERVDVSTIISSYAQITSSWTSSAQSQKETDRLACRLQAKAILDAHKDFLDSPQLTVNNDDDHDVKNGRRRGGGGGKDELSSSIVTDSTTQAALRARRQREEWINEDGLSPLGGTWPEPTETRITKDVLADPTRHLRTIQNCAVNYMKRSRYNEALHLLDIVLECQRDKNGPLHEDVGAALYNVGIAHLRLENHYKALQAFEEAVRVRKGSIGRDHPLVAVTLVKVGITLLLLRRLEDSLWIFREALTVRKHSLGALHPSTARIYNNIGCVQVEFQQLKDARRAFEAALDIQRSALVNEPDSGPILFSAATTLLNLGQLYRKRNMHEKSAMVVREALTLQEKVLGQHHPSVLSILDNLAEACAKAGHASHALKYYNELMERYHDLDEEHNHHDRKHTKKGRGINSTNTTTTMKFGRVLEATILHKMSQIHSSTNDLDSQVSKLHLASKILRLEDVDDDNYTSVHRERERLERQIQIDIRNARQALEQQQEEFEWV